jgi:hypothetical protein
MKIRMLIPALLLSAAFVTPAAANYFHNPFENIYRNVGSAPNPTPQDVRENRLPIVTRNETNETRFPIMEAIRSIFSGRSAQAQSGSTQNVPTASPSR